jgi:hypothetical protein
VERWRIGGGKKKNEEGTKCNCRFESRRRRWWDIIFLLFLIVVIFEVMDGPRELSSTHLNRTLTTAPRTPIIIIVLFFILILSINILPPPRMRIYTTRRPRSICSPTIVYVSIILIL